MLLKLALLFILFCSSIAIAVEPKAKIYTPVAPGFAGKSGLQTLFVAGNSYIIPETCTGSALLDLLTKLYPHLVADANDPAIGTAVAVPTAEDLRKLAQALDYRDMLMRQYKFLLDACSKGD